MKNNSVKKCVICNNDKIGEFICINDKKYHLCCIEDLQKQNTELKERYNIRTKAYNNILLENANLKDNWNKLKEWLEEEYERCDKIGNPAIGCAMGQIKRIKSKMQEIEGGMNE